MNISETVYNQLAAFAKFSSASYTAADDVAMQGVDGNLHIESNVADSPNTIHHWSWKRSATNVASNNQIRSLFKNTVENLFGGPNNVPESVKAVMKMRDYDGKGHPLTARRINAVVGAIVKHLSGMVVNEAGSVTVGDKRVGTLELEMLLYGRNLKDLTLSPSEPFKREEEDGNIISTGTNPSINEVDDDDNIIKADDSKTVIKIISREEEKKLEESKNLKNQKSGGKSSNVTNNTGKTVIKIISKNDNVSSNPNTFGGKLKMFQQSGVVFGQAGFVSGQGNRVMNGLSTGPKIVKEEKKEGENIVDNIVKQTNEIKVIHNKKPKSKKPITFTE